MYTIYIYVIWSIKFNERETDQVRTYMPAK